MASTLTEGWRRRSRRRVVGHPSSPPYLLPVVVVPSPATADAIVADTVAVYRSAGLRPVLVRRRSGFVFNRLQGALLRERAYCLVRDGVAGSLERYRQGESAAPGSGCGGLHRRAVQSRRPQTPAAVSYLACRQDGPGVRTDGRRAGQHDPWTPELVAGPPRSARALLDLRDWDQRVPVARPQTHRTLFSSAGHPAGLNTTGGLFFAHGHSAIEATGGIAVLAFDIQEMRNV